MSLSDELPRLLPLACDWAEEQAAIISRGGRSLTSGESTLALSSGVRRPERVRIALVDAIPRPEHPALRAACEQLSFLGPDTIGLTLGYGVFLKREAQASRRLLAHEFRHVAQYESYGSIKEYLAVYIPQLLQFGYENAPMEIDARAAEGGGGCRTTGCS